MFAQLTAELAAPDEQLTFGTDRVRVKAEVTSGCWRGGGVLNFGVRHLRDHAVGTLANVVADLYANYRLADNQNAGSSS